MTYNSKKELLEWLALKPRTQGWGAIVTYDRNKCNALLLQDYVHKFTTDSYLPPISKPVATGEANWELLHDWVTTQPSLSFENSSKTAGGEVRMTMSVVGGSQISIDNVVGHNRAIAIKSLDALDYPELIAEDVALSKTSGTVGKDTGEVVLDLGDPVTAKGIWKLTFANTPYEQSKGGSFFKKYFRDADPKKRVYHLGKVAFSDQKYLQPESFELRTMTAPGAESSDSKNFGDGRVEMFVRMEGDAEGGMPPRDDWRSLIPEGGSESIDASVLISHKKLIRELLGKGFEKVNTFGTVNFEEVPVGSDGFIDFIVPSENVYTGYTYAPAVSAGGVQLTFRNGEKLCLAFDHDRGKRTPLSLSFIRQGEKAFCLKVSFGSQSDRPETYPVLVNDKEGFYEVVTAADAFYKYEVDSVVGKAKLVRTEIQTYIKATPSAELKPLHSQATWDALAAALDTEMKEKWRERISEQDLSATEIDVFLLHSILFTQESSVKLKSAEIPGDLLIFGEIRSPFIITSQDLLMGHSATHLFKISPEFTGKVKWSVKTVPGSTGAAGSVNEDTGLYTSPGLDDIDGTYTRVIVTATDTSSTYSSSALVTVVVRDITVNPVVQICNASPASPEEPVTRTLSANTLGEGVLEWKVIKGKGSIPPRAGPDRKNIYTAGPKNTDLEGSFTVDEIEVKNLATGKTQSAYVLVNHFPQDLKMLIDMEQSSFPTGKAKLKVMTNRDRPVENAAFEVIAGNGSVDSSGIYTSDSTSAHRFALVKASRITEDEEVQDSWILLTYPLIELPNKPIDDLEDYFS